MQTETVDKHELKVLRTAFADLAMIVDKVEKEGEVTLYKESIRMAALRATVKEGRKYEKGV